MLLFSFVIVCSSSVSALSLLTHFDNGLQNETIYNGASTSYNVLAIADQDLDHMVVRADLYRITNGQVILVKNLFTNTTTNLFFNPNPFPITPNDYNNLPGDYQVKVVAEEWLTNGMYAIRMEKLNLTIIGQIPNIPPIADFIYSPQNPTTNNIVTFTSTSHDPDGYIVKWEWFIGSEKIGEGQIIQHQFSQIGTYVVTLKVTDNGGLADSTSKTIVITQVNPGGNNPVANFSFNPKTPTTCDKVEFTSTSYDPNTGGYITLIEWDLNGDGIFETSGQTVSTQFTTTGMHTVSIRVTNNIGLVTILSKQIMVRPCTGNLPPIADFIHAPFNPIEGDVVTFTSTSHDPDGWITQYAWFIEGTPSGNSQIINHIFQTAGQYTIKLTVTDNSGLTDSKTAILTVAKNISENNTQNGTVILIGLGCNPDVVKGDIEHCSAQVKYEMKDVKVVFKYADNNEELGTCYTNFEGYCHINPTITRDIGAYKVYALASKDGFGYDFTRRLNTTFKVWNERYEIRNLKTYENKFTILNKTFYRSKEMYASFIIYDKFTGKIIPSGSGQINEKVFIKINNIEPTYFVKMLNSEVTNDATISTDAVSTDSSTSATTKINAFNSIVNKLLSVPSLINNGIFDRYTYYYKLAYIPITDDFQGNGKVFVIITGPRDNDAGEGWVDVSVLNNPVKFTLPRTMLINHQTILDMNQYMSDVETPNNKILLTWTTNNQISVQDMGNHVLKLTTPQNFKSGTITFKADDDDEAITYATLTLTDKNNNPCKPVAVLNMAESFTVGSTVNMDGSKSYAGCNATIISYNWKIINANGLQVSSTTTTTPQTSYLFNTHGQFNVVLTIYTSKKEQANDTKIVFAGKEHSGVVVGDEYGLFVDYFDATGYGLPYGEIKYDEPFLVSATYTNKRGDDIPHLRMIFTIPELGYKLEGEEFHLNNGQTKEIHTEGFLDMIRSEVPPGDYIAMIGVSDDDTIRMKYFPLTIR